MIYGKVKLSFSLGKALGSFQSIFKCRFLVLHCEHCSLVETESIQTNLISFCDKVSALLHKEKGKR